MAKRKVKHKVISKKHVARREQERKQTTLVRNIAIGIVVAVILVMGYGYLDQTVLQNQKAVATVNDQKISISQFQVRVKLERENMINQYIQYAQMGQQFGMDVNAQIQPIENRLSQPTQLGKDVLDTMVNELIYEQEANKRGITISADKVEKEVQSFLGYFPDGTPTSEPKEDLPVAEEYPTLTSEQLAIVTITPLPTDVPTSTPKPTEIPTEEVEATPTSEAIPTIPPLPTLTATPYTADGYESTYKEVLTRYTDTGMTEKDFRRLFESQLYYEALYEIVTADVSQIDEQIWARHILVPDAALAAVVVQRLEEGEDFGDLAMELSIDPSAKTNQGDLGWFGHSMMIPEFEDAAYALENIGDISEPVQTQYGFHIIQLLGRTERPLDPNAYQNAKDIVFQAWLAEIRQDYNIEILDIWEENVPTEPDLQQTLEELFGAQQ